eukprot:15483081-Alexandrium_andersonii.AAC.1
MTAGGSFRARQRNMSTPCPLSLLRTYSADACKPARAHMRSRSATGPWQRPSGATHTHTHTCAA